jgi:uncharacterized protein YsxB (DUF464 family)
VGEGVITITIGQERGLTFTRSEGHASDIVCAEISTIMNTAILGLMLTAHLYPEEVAINAFDGAEPFQAAIERWRNLNATP